MATPVTLEECEVNLNICIPQDVWDGNPKFASLLTELATKKLVKFSIPQSTWSKYETLKQESKIKNVNLFYYKILYETILDILYEKSVDDSPVGLMASHALDYISIQETVNAGPEIVPKKYTDSFIEKMDNPEGFEMLKDAIGNFDFFLSPLLQCKLCFEPFLGEALNLAICLLYVSIVTKNNSHSSVENLKKS